MAEPQPSDGRIALEALNAADPANFERLIGAVFEHAPWVAARAAGRRPFATVDALHAAMFAAVAETSPEERLALIRNHPELAGKEAQAGAMTSESISEQGSIGLDRLAPHDFIRLAELNAAYRARFGFPFMICVRRHTRASIFSEFERRLGRSPDEESADALAQIFFVSRLRVADRVDGPGRPKVDGRLSTHVLDTVAGRPAAGVLIALRDLSDGGAGVLMTTVTTNADGRTDEPLIAGQPLRIGTYELAFHIGDYFTAQGTETASPPFLSVVPIRFSIAQSEAHYHVPLLATPWSYSTYRGS